MSEQDIYRSLPPVAANFFDVAYQDNKGSSKRYTRTLSFTVDPEMHDVLQSLAQDNRTPFLTSRNAMMRHFCAAGIESLQSFLSPEMKTTWSRLHSQQRRITNETYARLIEDNIEADIVNLTFISEAKEWKAVADHLVTVCQELAGISEPVWRANAARGWTSAMRGLKVLWSNEMPEDAPRQWERVRTALDWFDDAARL